MDVAVLLIAVVTLYFSVTVFTWPVSQMSGQDQEMAMEIRVDN
jgi:hypothetical protein